MEDIARMIRGFRRFQSRFFSDEGALYRDLDTGQRPGTMVISCSDSRVDPALITGSDLGELFVVRNVANLVPPYQPDSALHGVSAALEYAVTILGVSHIIVLGHSHCGGIAALTSPENAASRGEFIGPWVSIARPAWDVVRIDLAHKNRDAQLRACEQAALLLSLENLLSFPWISARVDDGSLHLHGWYYDLEHGTLSAYQPEHEAFTTLVSPPRGS